jgi:hypothetical protein
MLLPSGPTPERGLAAVGWLPLPAKRRHTRAADCQLALQSALLVGRPPLPVWSRIARGDVK